MKIYASDQLILRLLLQASVLWNSALTDDFICPHPFCQCRVKASGEKSIAASTVSITRITSFAIGQELSGTVAEH